MKRAACPERDGEGAATPPMRRRILAPEETLVFDVWLCCKVTDIDDRIANIEHEGKQNDARDRGGPDSKRFAMVSVQERSFPKQ